MNRAYLLAALLSLVGLMGLTAALRNLGQALLFRLRPGKPYIAKSLQRSLTSTLLLLLVTLAGASLGAVRWLARDYQHVPGTTRAGRLLVGGETPDLLQLQADRRHPGAPSFASGLEGSGWQVRGIIITFPEWTRHLGLGAFHRFTAAGPVGEPAGDLPPACRHLRTLVAALPPILGVREDERMLLGRGELPLWTAILVGRDGYTLGGADGGDALLP